MARLWTPSTSHPRLPRADAGGKRSIVCFHGAESHSGWFGPFAFEALRRGIWSAVIAADRPGWRGDLQSKEETWHWIEGSLLEVPADHEIDVVATSWGGLAVLSCLVERPGPAWDRVKAVHLVAPGIFPSIRLQLKVLWRGMLDSLRGRGFLAGRVELGLVPADFAATPEMRAWVAGDKDRNSELSVDFLRVTGSMRRVVTAAVESGLLAARIAESGINLVQHLPGSDPVIDLSRTENLLAMAGARLVRYPAQCHGLVLEHHSRMVDSMAETLRHTTRPEWKLEVFERKSPFRFRVRHAQADRTGNDAIFLRIIGKSRDGRVVEGIGEALPRDYLTGETTASARRQCENLFETLAIPVLEGAVAEGVDVDAIVELLVTAWRQASARRCLAIWAAFDVALIDWVSRACGIPVHELVSRIACQVGAGNASNCAEGRATIPMLRPVVAAGLALVYKLAGFRRFKLKVGDADGAARVRAVGKILRPGRGEWDLTLDANQAFSREAASDFVTRIKETEPRLAARIVAFEDPLRPSRAVDLAGFAPECAFPVMADEELSGEDSIRAFSMHPEIATWNIRVGKCGGITGSLVASAAATRAGARVAIGALVGEDQLLGAAARQVESVVPVAWSERNFSWIVLRTSVVCPVKRFLRDRDDFAGLGLRMDETRLRAGLASYSCITKESRRSAHP